VTVPDLPFPRMPHDPLVWDEHAIANGKAFLRKWMPELWASIEDDLIMRFARLNFGQDPELARRVDEARQRVGAVARCRWSYANSMSFAFCETHSDYHRTFLTPPTICPTAEKEMKR